MNPLTACCTAPQPHWPFAVPLAGAWLFSNRFVPSQLADDDFARSGISAPPGLERAVAKRRAEFLAGRLCARAALERLGSALVSPQQAHAAPGLGEDRAPIWPLQVAGSITHSDGWAAAIAAPHSAWRGLGLDAETLLGSQRAERLAGEILTPAELQRLAGLPAEQRARRITLTFSLKESLFKALYPLVLKRFYFEHAEVLDCSDPGKVRLRLLTGLSEEFGPGSEFSGQCCEFDGRVLTLVYL